MMSLPEDGTRTAAISPTTALTGTSLTLTRPAAACQVVGSLLAFRMDECVQRISEL